MVQAKQSHTQHSQEYWLARFRAEQEQLLANYFRFLSFSSISADPGSKPALQDCAEWLTNFYKKTGFSVTHWPTPRGAPVVLARSPHVPNAPTLLIYNHYDVQPVDPIELWEQDPFTPLKKDDTVIARGAQDNKGQCFYVMAALSALMDEYGSLPLNVIHFIEGEEESGSEALFDLLEAHKDEIAADYVLVVDVGMPSRDQPAVTLGVRGLVTCHVEVEGSSTDLHSGSHGGIVYNPLRALVEMLASLRDPHTGRVLIPGFYDAVVDLTPQERSFLDMHFDDAAHVRATGAEATGGEKGYSATERRWLRPTLEINGIQGGYTGPGFKTVIPAKASANISCRLVPDQDPAIIAERLKLFLEATTPKGIKATVTIHPGMGLPVRGSPANELAASLIAACREVFGKRPYLILEGASIPITSALTKASGGELAMFGLGLDSDKIHAPNEEFSISRIEQGYLCIIGCLEELKKVRP